MQEQLRSRLEELKHELELGQTKLRELETQEMRLRETLLRISGAIQVLEEMLAAEADAAPQGASAADVKPTAAQDS
jgi:predicted nuclease with TOPRIM domain